jgi:hypothetical protein
MNTITLNVIVEDVVSEAAMSRILAYVGYTGNVEYRIVRGNGNIRKNIGKYKGASRVFPHIVLTDQDRYPCPPALLNDWQIGVLPAGMLFRIATHEAEAWLLADRQGIAEFFNTIAEKIPSAPETLTDPKQTVFSIVRKTRKRRLIEEMVPQPGAHIGPLYNERMCEFIVKRWSITNAVENSPCLARNIARISTFLRGYLS